MFMEERHQKIYEMLKNTNRVEVQALSHLFDVSEDSIRRDLRLMEKKGLVQRTYGGAILPAKVSITQEFSSREKMQPEIKEEIALTAVSFIQEHDTILLDGSTTVAKLIPYLNVKQFKDITVITNSIVIAHEIISMALDIKLYLIGGSVRTDIANAIGNDSLQQLRGFYVDKVFIGACSISTTGSLSTPVIEEAPIKRAMLEAGREIYIMADSSKFGQMSLAQFGILKPEYTVLTDSGFSQAMRDEMKELTKKGLRIIS